MYICYISSLDGNLVYIIEKLIKFYIKLTKKESAIISANFDDNYVLEDIVTCKHHFLPIDSTKKIFACSKCGYVVKRERLRRKK